MAVPIYDALKKSTPFLLIALTPHIISTVIVCAYSPSLN
jgi:hypothetical protein